jgi:putative phosphoribosyl transferase
MRFRDRADAGRRLAMMMLAYRGEATRVLGLDGGGLRVGYEVAQALGAPLDVWMARGVESSERGGRPVGAVSEGEGLYLDVEGIRSAVAPAAELARWMDAEAGEVALAAQRLRGGHPRLEVTGCTAVLVVDGIAGDAGPVFAALRGLRRQGPRRLVLAAPVASAEELERLRPEADEVLCCRPSWSLITVAHAYDDFREVPEVEARQVLERARHLGVRGEGLGPQGSGDWM